VRGASAGYARTVLARRLLLFVSALLGLALVAAALAPQQRPVAPAPAVNAPTVARSGLPAGREVSLTVRDRPGHAPTRLHARVGDTVLLTVHSARPDTVTLDGLTRPVPVEAGIPARLEQLLDTPGDYRILLVDAGRRLGTLVVR
jgi:hypothetical protein